MFHPEAPSSSGKLPLTLFEGVRTTTEAGSMDVDGADSPYKFRELAYSVETGEAEMISVDFVARGGGNATAITQSKPPQKDSKDDKTKGKGKAQGGDAQVNGVQSASYLTAEDEEIITSLTAKANAIKMLHQRIALLHTYLSSLPPTYLSDASLPVMASGPSPLNHQILRSASALLARLPLLIPADTPAFERESLEEKSDVELISLLSQITSSTQAAKELGRKHAVVEQARSSERSRHRGGAADFHGGNGEFMSPTGGSGMDPFGSERVMRELTGGQNGWGR